MSDPFIAEIRIFASNFAPSGWAFCNGQLLQVAQNTALFSLVGTTYGGNGSTNFALPNLQGRAPMHQGSGPGLTPRSIGASGGSTTETLTEAQIPQHSHPMRATSSVANTGSPPGALPARSSGGYSYVGAGGTLAPMHPNTVSSVGGNQSHNNLQPYLALNFIVALVGIYPSQS